MTQIRKWWRWAGRELDWAWNGGRRIGIIAGAVNGAMTGGILGTYGFYHLKAGEVNTGIFFFISALAAFTGLTGANWWMDRNQSRGIYEVRPKQSGGKGNDPG